MIVVTFDSSVNLVNVLFVFCFNQFYLCCHLTNKVVYIITASMSHCHPQVIIIIIMAYIAATAENGYTQPIMSVCST